MAAMPPRTSWSFIGHLGQLPGSCSIATTICLSLLMCALLPKAVAGSTHLQIDSPPTVSPSAANGTAQRFPYALGLRTRSADCSAVLVREDAALTAASCMPAMMTVGALEGMTLYAGAQDTPWLTSDASATKVSVRSVLIHPLFNPDKLEVDVALIILDRCVTGAADNIKPINFLATDADWADASTGKTQWVAPGWGITSEGVTGDGLAPMNYTLLQYNGVCPGSIDDLRVCAVQSTAPTNGSCTGDLGGPVVYNPSNVDDPRAATPEKDRLIGIYSTGCSLTGKPGFMTGIMRVRDWINDVLDQVEPCRPPLSTDRRPECSKTILQLSPDSLEGGCNTAQIHQDSLLSPTPASNTTLWIRRANASTTDSLQPQAEGLWLRIPAGQVYGFSIVGPSGLACSGYVAAKPCVPQCMDVTVTTAATASDRRCVGTLWADKGGASDFWDMRTVGQGAVTTVFTFKEDTAGGEYIQPVRLPPGRYTATAAVVYPGMRSPPSAPCQVTVRDVTVLGPPANDRRVACFWRAGRGFRQHAVPLIRIADLPSGPKCYDGFYMRLVALSCEPHLKGRTTFCWPNNVRPRPSPLSAAPRSAVTVPMRGSLKKQRLTVTVQLWDFNGPVGGGMDPANAGTATINITLFRSEKAAGSGSCIPVTDTWDIWPMP